MSRYRENPDYLDFIDELFSFFRTHDVENFREKIGKIGEIRQFQSFISELHFAQFLIEKGWGVEFILDSDNGRTSPDILCIQNDRRMIVEVTSLTEDTIVGTVLDFLRLLFEKMPALNVRIDINLKDSLSIPQIVREERHIQNNIVFTSISEFMHHLRNNELPLPPYRIETTGMFFNCVVSKTEKGFPGPIITDCIGVPCDELRENISKIILSKANKHPSFETGLRQMPYIIAFDCGESLFDHSSFNTMLYGKCTTIASSDKRARVFVERMWQQIIDSPDERIPNWTKIEFASRIGWRDKLIEMHMIPNQYTYLSEPGILLKNAETQNVSGFLFRNKMVKPRFYPNPFCTPNINLKGEILF